MSSLFRAALSVVSTLALMMGIGCATTSSPRMAMQREASNDPRMYAARMEASKGNLVEAKRIYKEIHEQNLQNAECSHRLAVICTRLNEHNEADVYYRQSYAVNPNDPVLLSDMGFAAFQRKEYEQAEAFLEQSVRLNCNDQRTISNLAIVRGWLEKDEACLTAFRRIYTEADSIRHLAAIQFARGDKERGQINVELANRLDPRNAIDTNIASQNRVDSTKTATIELPPPLPRQSQTVEPPPEANTVYWAPPIPTAVVAVSEVIQAPAAPVEPVELPAPLPPTVPPLPDLEQPRPTTRPKFVTEMSLQLINDQMARAAFCMGGGIGNFRSENENIRSVLIGKNEQQTLIPPSPDVSAEKKTTSDSTQVSKPTPSSVWRRTPKSHGGKSDHATAVRFAPNEIHQISLMGEEVDDQSRIKSVCLVTLFEERKLVRPKTEFSAEYQSRRYAFSSEEALGKFLQDPERYAPVAGGIDVVSVRNERIAVQGSVNFAVWYRRQLYLFATTENANAFRQDPHLYVATN